MSERTPSAELLAESGLGEVSGFSFMAGRGCASCRGTGFKGRKAVAEGWLGADEEAVLFNCATGLKYPMPDTSRTLDKNAPIDFSEL